MRGKKAKVEEIDKVLSRLEERTKNDLIMNSFRGVPANSTAYTNQQNADEVMLEEVMKKSCPDLYRDLFAAKNTNGTPKFYELTSEDNLNSKREQRVNLFSTILKAFVIHVRNKRNGKPLEPSTTNAFLRRFLAHVKSKYNIVMSISEDFGKDGGLNGKYSNLFNNIFSITYYDYTIFELFLYIFNSYIKTSVRAKTGGGCRVRHGEEKTNVV